MSQPQEQPHEQQESMDVQVLNTITGTVVTIEAVKSMDTVLSSVCADFGPGVVKRPSPSGAPRTGATVTGGSRLVPDQVLEWYPAAAAAAGYLLTEYLVSPTMLVTVKRSVFLLQDKEDPRPVGVGVFFAPKLAVTANHNLLESTGVRSKVTASFGGDSPRHGETLELVVMHRNTEADFALLQASDEQPDYLAPYTGIPEHLQARTVALCSYQLEIAPELGPIFGSVPSLGTMRGTVVKLSPHQNHLIVQSDSWPGDSGAAVIVSNGQLVGILTEGVNSLRDKIEEHATINERLNEVEESLAQVARSVASGCIILSHKVFVERAQQLGLR